jgi:hypothetical protein
MTTIRASLLYLRLPCRVPCAIAGAFAGGVYDAEDKEADQIWDAVDEFMDERRRVCCERVMLF